MDQSKLLSEVQEHLQLADWHHKEATKLLGKLAGGGAATVTPNKKGLSAAARSKVRENYRKNLLRK